MLSFLEVVRIIIRIIGITIAVGKSKREPPIGLGQDGKTAVLQPITAPDRIELLWFSSQRHGKNQWGYLYAQNPCSVPLLYSSLLNPPLLPASKLSTPRGNQSPLHNMLIYNPHHNLIIRARHHIIPRIPFHDTHFPFPRQMRNRM